MRIYKLVMSAMSLTTLPVKKTTRDQLRQFGQKGETWDQVIQKLMSKEKKESLSGSMSCQTPESARETPFVRGDTQT